MRKLYIDIDGVLLTKRHVKAAEGALELIGYVLSHFDCYWLTTHCRNGDASHALHTLEHYYPSEIIDRLRKVKPTTWRTLKTEGIDFDSDFYWLDDWALEKEKKVLAQHHCYTNLIEVDLSRNDELLKVIRKLEMTLVDLVWEDDKSVFNKKAVRRLLEPLKIVWRRFWPPIVCKSN